MAALARTLKQIGVSDWGLLSSVQDVVSKWVARSDARRELGELSDRMLIDVGMDPEEIRKEVDKPFWQA